MENDLFGGSDAGSDNNGESDAMRGELLGREAPIGLLWYQRFRNDDGAPVAFGTEETHRIYCGRNLGREAIPRSDGRCGPKNGPQCASCQRYERGPGRVDLLIASFPSLLKLRRSNRPLEAETEAETETANDRRSVPLTAAPDRWERAAAVATAALRGRGGLVEFAATRLSDLGAVRVDPPQAALPPLSPSTQALAPVDNTMIRRLMEMFGLTTTAECCEAALRRREGNLEAAVAWVLDEPDAVREAAEEDRRIAETAEREAAEASAAWEAVTRRAAEADVPEAVGALCGGCPTPIGLGTDVEAGGSRSGAGVVVTNGHRMILANANDTSSCILCAGKVPSSFSGSYLCEACNLCQGCVQAGAVQRCPRLGNGSHLHHHPLTYDSQERTTGAFCDVNNEGCLGQRSQGRRRPIVWFCRECSWDVCVSCMSLPKPEGYERLTCSHGWQNKGEEVEELEGPNGKFDEVAAERRAAVQWEGSYEEPMADADVVVGTGIVGTTAAVLSPNLARRGATSVAMSLARGSRQGIGQPLRTGGRLPDDATRALELFRKTGHNAMGVREGVEGTPSSKSSLVAAADVTRVEDILHRANAIGNSRTNHPIWEAVAAGRLEIAGTLLLSRAFAPFPSTIVTAPLGSDSDNEDAESDSAVDGTQSERNLRCLADVAAAAGEGDAMCWCGGIIDAKTSPDGAVGCLGGHAMHAACAADLLLGGGDCPSCRQPLFFPRISSQEARSAANHVEGQIIDRRRHEEEKIQKEAADLALLGRKLVLNVGDVVRVSNDRENCCRVQSADPRRGGWDEDMINSCGKEGRIIEIITEGNGGSSQGVSEVTAVRVQTSPQIKSSQHSFVPIQRGGGFICPRCGMAGPSRHTGRHKCDKCSLCEKCSRRPGYQQCAKDNFRGWLWDPSLLLLICRSDALASCYSSLADHDDMAAKEVEQLVVRLRAELKAVIMAREAIKAEMTIPPKPEYVGMDLSMGAKAALSDLQKIVSPADWWRARHILLLASQWDDSSKANSKRGVLYKVIQNGEIDRAARIVRRYNVSRTSEACWWADALAKTAEYIVEPTAKVHLHAFPSMVAPKTGHVLEPESHFHSSREILDSNGTIWIQIADATPVEAEHCVVADIKDPMTNRMLLGARVLRGKDWMYNNQDGGEGNEGVIVKADQTGFVSVKWDSNKSREFKYRATKSVRDLMFAGAPPPPPQGWLCVSPGGLGSPNVVKRARSSLRCFCCGDGLVPLKLGTDNFSSVRGRDVKIGERLLVAATLEPVTVENIKHGRIYCSFSSQADTVWYRPEDVVLAKGYGEIDSETVLLGGRMRNRREVVLMHGGDGSAAKRAWNDARTEPEAKKEIGDEEQEDTLGFASCLRGHLLHARCFQGALFAGQSCPAPGCTESLWLPKVNRIQTEEGVACCGGDTANREEEVEVNRMADELVTHAAQVVSQASERTGIPAEEEITNAGIASPKMCPVCCSGPLLNENCSDMQAHHGQCTAVAIRGRRAAGNCTDRGVFQVSASDIAESLIGMPESESVADVLPKCPKHQVLVMFNGCMNCGHLFTGTSWDDMPDFDPEAMAMLDLDKRKRRAAGLLAKQIRAEAAMLQFERDAVHDKWGKGLKRKRTDGSSRNGINEYGNEVLCCLPCPPPHIETHRVRGCSPDCTENHSSDGECLVCGRLWRHHSGHTCQGGARGSWQTP